MAYKILNLRKYTKGYSSLRLRRKKERHGQLTALLMVAPMVYMNGFKAELIGRTNTAIHAYTSPDITWSLRAITPAQKIINSCELFYTCKHPKTLCTHIV